MFWKKRTVEELPIAVEEIETELSPTVEMQQAVKIDREYIEIQMESLSIDVIEMMHFFNELPSRLSPILLNKNEQAIDYFRNFTGVYVGNVFEFYQTVVLFYYKNWHNPNYPFQGTQLEFVFSKVAHNMLESLMTALQEEQYHVNSIIEMNPKAFYFHEDYVEMHSNRFLRTMITFIPQFENTEFYTPIEHEFVALGNEVYTDVRQMLYEFEHQEFSSFDQIYHLIEKNQEMSYTPDFVQVKAMFYYPIKDLETIRVLQYIRLYRLQQVIVKGLNYDLTVQVKNIKTVGMLQHYLFNENEQLYSQNKTIFQENQRFLNLFFDKYFFEHAIDEEKDSPRVRSCLNEMLQEVKLAQKESKFTGELEIMIRKAYYEHKLIVGN